MMFLDERGRLIGRVAGADDPMTAFVALKNLSLMFAELSETGSGEQRVLALVEVAWIETMIQRCGVTDLRLLGMFRPVARSRRN